MADTTVLDLVTFVIALAGLIIALVSLGLGIRRDRRDVSAQVRIEAERRGSDLVVAFTNMAHRPLSIRRAWILADVRYPGYGKGFDAWQLVDGRAPLPSPTLKPGDPPYEVRANREEIRRSLQGHGIGEIQCQDERGNFYTLHFRRRSARLER